MTRRELLIGLVSAKILARQSRAAELPGFYYRDYSRCLPQYMTTLAQDAYQRRNHEIEKLSTPADVAARQNWVGETVWKLIGGQLQPTPLNARVTGTVEHDGYRLEKVVYESRPRLFVSANLYLPTTGRPAYPGILFQMGHSLEGKAYPSYQKCCQGLARLGYVVLAFDPMGQGERIYYPNADGTDTRTGSADAEHTVPGKQMLLLGNTATQFQLWDAVRSLDFLASHPMVDRNRLGGTGQSGGATLTMLLAAVDSRLSAAVISSGNTENVASADYNPPGSVDDAEQNFVGSGPLGFDRWDLLYPMAPKPLLILVSSHDFFGTYSPRYLSNGREEYFKLAKTYELLGKRDQLDWQDTPLPHGLTYPLRLQTYNWFERWLKDSTRKVEQEPAVSPESARVLSTGANGNVVRDRQSLRPIDLVRRGAEAVRREVGAGNWSEAGPGNWMQALQVWPSNTSKRFSKLSEVRAGDIRIEASELQTDPEIWLPTWILRPVPQQENLPALLLLDDRGRNRNSAEDGLYYRLARAGRLVCAADLRGVGDLSPEVGRGNPGYTIPQDSEENFAWACLILGRSLLAQRITDILALISVLKNEGNSRIVLAARGALAVPALFAFQASPEVDTLYLASGLVSYRQLLDTEFYSQTLANFAFDLYREIDLPALAHACAPRIVHLAGMTDAAGKRMSVEAVRSEYPSGHVRVSSDRAWDVSTLKSL
jgi:dienelactone hydrolase